MKYLFFIFLALAGCHQDPHAHRTFIIAEITGRDARPVYRVKVPTDWVCLPPEIGENLADTTSPNFTFLIDDAIHVTVHTFPSDSLNERISPQAQVERWRRQIAPLEETVQGVCRGGFIGLLYEGKQVNETVLAWSMQLDPDHYLTLQFLEGTPEEREFYKQLRADYTIKVTGPAELIEKRRTELLNFARSFELIQEIPKRR